MRLARTVVLGVALLLLPQGASGSSRASATAGASLTIIDPATPGIQLPKTVTLSASGRLTIPIQGRVRRAPPLPPLSITAASSGARVRLLDDRSGAVLEIELEAIPLADIALPLQVTYHQY